MTPFDWRRITWGRPDSPVTVLCSYCSAALSDDDVPLILATEAGFAARFCPQCTEAVSTALVFGPRPEFGLPPSPPGE